MVEEELNYYIAAYLENRFPKTFKCFISEGCLKDSSLISNDVLLNRFNSLHDLKAQNEDLTKNNALLRDNWSKSEHKSDAEFLPALPTEYEDCCAGIESHFSISKRRSPVNVVTFHPRLAVIAAGLDNGVIEIWDLKTNSEIRTLSEHSDAVTCICFNPSGSNFVSGGKDANIRLWQWSSLQVIKSFLAHSDAILSLSYTCDGANVISASRDKTLRLWNVETGSSNVYCRGDMDWVRACAGCPQMPNFFVSGNRNDIYLWWLVQDGHARITDITDAHEHVIESLIFGTDATLKCVGESETLKRIDPSLPILFSASRDKSIKLWDVLTGTLMMKYLGHTDWVTSLCLHSNGRYLFSCSHDLTIKMWNVLTGECTHSMKKAHASFITSLTTHPCTASIVSGSVDKNIKIWRSLTS